MITMATRRQQRTGKYRTVGGLKGRIRRDGRSAAVLVVVALILATVGHYAGGPGWKLTATAWWAGVVIYACLASGAFNLCRMIWDAVKLARLAKN